LQEQAVHSPLQQLQVQGDMLIDLGGFKDVSLRKFGQKS
jgi:hypothetical protein